MSVSHFEREGTPYPAMFVCKFGQVKKLLQLIMESAAWCAVWFGLPNEDWIHPQSLTVC